MKVFIPFTFHFSLDLVLKSTQTKSWAETSILYKILVLLTLFIKTILLYSTIYCSFVSYVA